MSAETPYDMDAVNEAARRASRALAERLEREVVGAWRAGYEALVVLHEPNLGGAWDEAETTFSLGRYAYVPTDHPEDMARAGRSNGCSTTVYDLDGLDAETLREVRA